jgi:signal peptidase II
MNQHLIRLGLLIATLVFAADQLSKYWILRVVKLVLDEPIQITTFMNFDYALNKGVSYGLLSTHQQGLLVALSFAIAIMLVIWLRKASKPLPAASFGMMIGGALGNALDRLLHGGVVDFVSLHWNTWHWYIFNVADIAIVAGVALLLYDAVFDGKKT